QTFDRHQFRVLLRTSLKLDWRGTNNPFAGYQNTKSKIPGMAVILGINFFASISLSGVVALVADEFSALVLSAGMGMLLVAIQVLLEFGNVIVSPNDYNILAPHPINSRTYYVTKLAHMLVYVGILSASLTILPAIVAGITMGAAAIPILILHYLLCNVFAAVFVVNIYTWILQKVDRQRLERWLGYVHTVMVLGVMLVLNGLFRFLKDAVKGFNVESVVWLKALPSYWFGTPIRLVLYGWDTLTFSLFLLGLLALFVLARYAFSHLSLSYAESLTRTAWSRRHTPTPGKTGPFIRLLTWRAGPEDLALLTLVRSNFKHDTQFRLGIMAIFPLMLFYLVYGMMIAEGGVRDPLNPLPGTDGIANMLFGFMATVSPYMILPAFQASKEWQAAWVFYATPLDRLKLVLAMTRFARLVIMLPMSITLFGLFCVLYGNPLHAAMHTVVLMLLSLIGVAVINTFRVYLPFARENTTASYQAAVLTPMLLSMALLGIPTAVISYVGYGGYLGWAASVGLLLLILLLFSRNRDRRIIRAAATWEFTG
ncbi:MAG: hypothetical protein KKA42_03815, partial [candidate division Zixibacteria bacterium]|nr:hypothetical protein [candidate division Zixibacteria bacterium]